MMKTAWTALLALMGSALLTAAPAAAVTPYLVADVNPFPEGADSNPHSFVTLGNAGLFAADDGETGSELWRSDGTAAGTYRLADA